MPITQETLLQLITQGESSQVEFKSAAVRAEAVAKEIVAFANYQGGILLIGVEDDGVVSGVSNSNLKQWIANITRHNIIPALNLPTIIVEVQGKKVLAVEIPKGVDKPYQTIDGKNWIRVGSTNRIATKEELSRLFQQTGLVHFDIAPVVDTSLKELDLNAIGSYYQTYYNIPFADLSTAEQENILHNADLSTQYEGQTVTTVGGLLLFGKQPQRRLPQAAITFAVFKGADVTAELIDKKEIIGTLPELIDKTVSLIQLFIPVSSRIEGNQRQENILIPHPVIREAIVNAVAHRDYSISQRKITVYLFKNRLEITSPGQLPNTLTLEKIRYGNSAPRNIFLVKYLDNMRYFDGLGRGIPMIIKAMGNKVEFEEIGILFRIKFWLANC
jgi:ATP-dependent DNA helicase RecG